jgi:hypothetical protein
MRLDASGGCIRGLVADATVKVETTPQRVSQTSRAYADVGHEGYPTSLSWLYRCCEQTEYARVCRRVWQSLVQVTGLYGREAGGVRVEDMLVVTSGEARNLNQLPDSLCWD